jgi:hypothetical protein
MTLQTNLLEMRLAQGVTKAQQMLATQLAPGGGLLDDGRVWFDNPAVVAFWRGLDTLHAELRRVLRQFGQLQRQRDTMEAALAAVPHDQRWREQSRIASFDDDLSRVLRRAARLSALLATLRRRGGEVSAVEWSQGIHHLGAEVGKVLDQLLVRRTVQQVTMEPVYRPPAAAAAAPGALLETLFVVVALATVLLRRGKGDR